MKRLGFLFVLLFASSLSLADIVHPAAPNACNSFFANATNRDLLGRLQQIKSIGALWDTYDPFQSAYALTDGKECVSVISKGRVLANIQTSSSINTPYFNAYLKGFTDSAFPKELQSVMNDHQIGCALVLNTTVSNDELLSGLGLDHPYDVFLAGADDYLFQVLTHEGFHISGQFAAALNSADRSSWPSWAAELPDRSALPHVCYSPTPEIDALHQNEIRAMNSALRLAWFYNRPDLLRKAVADYLSYRNQRYQALTKVVVPFSSQPAGISCRQAEAIMELVEGSALFLQEEGELGAGFSTKDQVLAYIASMETTGGGGYYVMGAAKLFILKQLYPDEFAEITHRIGTSPSSNQGIDFEFERKFGR